MRKSKIKTIDINFNEWFDKVNGNSYCAGFVIVNFGMKSRRDYKCPFEGGYGDHYITIAANKLIEEKELKEKESVPLWRYCRENNIVLRTVKHENCLKRELVI